MNTYRNQLALIGTFLFHDFLGIHFRVCHLILFLDFLPVSIRQAQFLIDLGKSAIDELFVLGSLFLSILIGTVIIMRHQAIHEVDTSCCLLVQKADLDN